MLNLYESLEKMKNLDNFFDNDSMELSRLSDVWAESMRLRLVTGDPADREMEKLARRELEREMEKVIREKLPASLDIKALRERVRGRMV